MSLFTRQKAENDWKENVDEKKSWKIPSLYSLVSAIFIRMRKVKKFSTENDERKLIHKTVYTL